MWWKLDDHDDGSVTIAAAEEESAVEDAEASGGDMDGVDTTVPDLSDTRPDQGVTVVQVLGLLQREGRLIDFLQEDITPYSDEQIGAAVREVHKGCRQAMRESFMLAPVLDASEGSDVEIDEDFNPLHVKLVGNVHGKPPFRGVLRHCGWRYTTLNLPEWSSEKKTDVIAPAEVEIT
jgi:hypothetical protein